MYKFKSVCLDGNLREVTILDSANNITFKNIPVLHLKVVEHIRSPTLAHVWKNEIINTKNFPVNLKLAEVTPIFKKNDST